MKPLLLLLLGCLPLGVLTGRAFVELRSPAADSLGARPVLDPLPDVPVDTAAAPVKAEQALTQKLADADLLAGDTPTGLSDLPAQSCLRSLNATWPQWVAARQLVRRSLKIEREIQTADASRLGESITKLEDLKAEYEKLKPQQNETIVALLDQQIEAARQRIRRASLKSEADALLAQSLQEWQSAQYARCASLCEQWLAKYALLDPPTTAKMRVMCDRARFWEEAGQLSARWQADFSPSARKTLIEGFLAKHGRLSSPTEKQQGVLDRCRSMLASIDAQVEAERINRDAEQGVVRLGENPPPRLADRIQAAVEVRQGFPAAEVARRLRKTAAGWLAAALPEKELQEDLDLKEVETRQGQILRGYFREVRNGDGVAYQFYANRQEFLRPTTQVGAYGASQLLGQPRASAPRRCAGQYNELRNLALQSPAQKEAWEQLAAACEQFETTLAAYRAKPGSSREPLSFRAEAAVAREILSGPVWENMGKLFKP